MGLQNLEKSKGYLRRALQLLITITIFATIMFVFAGRLNYWQGWVFLGGYLGFIGIGVIGLRTKKELINERANPGEGIKKWDRYLLGVYNLMLFVGIAYASIDAGRFNAQIPLGWYIFGCIIFACSFTLFYWSMSTNTYFSTVVRIQKDRGHKVIDSGPYRFIRHPGYLGMIAMNVGGVLVLGSLKALILAMVCVILIIIRTILEDRTLQRELSGYTDYTKRVRFRLFPGIW